MLGSLNEYLFLVPCSDTCIEAMADKSSISTPQHNTNIKILHKLPFDGDRPPHTLLPGSESLHVSNGNEFLPLCHRPDIQCIYWLLWVL